MPRSILIAYSFSSKFFLESEVEVEMFGNTVMLVSVNVVYPLVLVLKWFACLVLMLVLVSIVI